MYRRISFDTPQQNDTFLPHACVMVSRAGFSLTRCVLYDTLTAIIQATTPKGNTMMDNNRSICSDSGMRGWHRHTCNAIAVWTFLCFAFILLVGCASSVNPKSTTPQATPTTPNLTQQYEFTAKDSGRIVTYTITSRFQIILNPQKYPKQNVRVSCDPQETLGSISNLPSVAPPLYAVRYQGVVPGVCTIKNDDFLLTVKIVPLND